VTVTDAANKKRSSVTDSLGRLSQVTEDPAGTPLTTSYSYDTLGNLTIVNQGGQYRYFFYDSLSRLVRAKNPEQDANSAHNLTNPPGYNNSWSLAYTYDANGNLSERKEARNNGSSVPITTYYGYDALGRNVWVSYNDGVTPGVERHYDALTNGKGRMYYDVNYTNNPATGNPAYSRLVIGGYDALGRVTSQTQGFVANDGATWKDFASTRTYDLAGHVLTQGYPSTRSVNYTYATSGRLSSAYGNLGGTSYTYADTISYNAAGQMLRERFGTSTNLYHNLHYNNRLQLVDIRLGDSSSDEWNWSRGALITYYGTAAVSGWDPFANSTDNNGNVLRQVNYVPLSGGGNVIPQLDDYTYDALNRLTSMTEAQQNSSGTWSFGVTSQTYSYDRWGNRTSVAGQTAQSWSTTEAAATNRLKLNSGNTCTGTKNGVCYDAAGNVVFDNQLSATGDRTYDAEGRIVTAGTSGANKYVYDADGKRVRRQVGPTQYWQVYGIGGELVAEYQWNGTTATLQKEYGYGGGVTVVAESATVVRWLVKDHLGTPRMIADQSGSLSGVTRHDYYPFGEENFAGATIRTTGNGYQAEGVRQKFTGYERDTETNLDYAQARYYSNLQGRFTSIDPLHSSAEPSEPQSWNRYSYVGNHPLVLTDPTGLLWIHRGDVYRWVETLTDKDAAAGWRAVTEFVIWTSDGWAALNPLRNEVQLFLPTRYQAEQAFRSMVIDADSPSSYHTYDGAGDVMDAISITGGLRNLGFKVLEKLFARIAARRAARAATEVAFDLGTEYASKAQMLKVIRELEAGTKGNAGIPIPANQPLSIEQLNGLRENVRLVITKTIEAAKQNAARISSVEEQLGNTRFRFLDQVPEAKAALQKAASEIGLKLP
jgi:RHS repeat-associated protein